MNPTFASLPLLLLPQRLEIRTNSGPTLDHRRLAPCMVCSTSIELLIVDLSKCRGQKNEALQLNPPTRKSTPKLPQTKKYT